MGNIRQWMKSLKNFLQGKAFGKAAVTIGIEQCVVYRIESSSFDFIFPVTLDFTDYFRYIHFLQCLEKGYGQYLIKCILFTLNYASDVYIEVISKISYYTTFHVTLVMLRPDRTFHKFLELKTTVRNLQSCFIDFKLPISMSMIKYILKESPVGESEIIDWIQEDECGIQYNRIDKEMIESNEHHLFYSKNI